MDAEVHGPAVRRTTPSPSYKRLEWAHVLMRVTHVGPDRHSPGGMGTVLRQYEAAHWESAKLTFTSSWSPSSRMHGLFLTIAGLLRLLVSTRKTDVVHVHVSERGSFVREGAFIFASWLLRI